MYTVFQDAAGFGDVPGVQLHNPNLFDVRGGLVWVSDLNTGFGPKRWRAAAGLQGGHVSSMRPLSPTAMEITTTLGDIPASSSPPLVVPHNAVLVSVSDLDSANEAASNTVPVRMVVTSSADDVRAMATAGVLGVMAVVVADPALLGAGPPAPVLPLPAPPAPAVEPGQGFKVSIGVVAAVAVVGTAAVLYAIFG